MFKQKGNINLINNRKVRTRAHDAILFTTLKPNSEKYKRNVLYKGAIAWNNLHIDDRNINSKKNLKRHKRGN